MAIAIGENTIAVHGKLGAGTVAVPTVVIRASRGVTTGNRHRHVRRNATYGREARQFSTRLRIIERPPSPPVGAPASRRAGRKASRQAARQIAQAANGPRKTRRRRRLPRQASRKRQPQARRRGPADRRASGRLRLAAWAAA